ncbi:OpgC domain-containing protein [Aquabacterium sp. J223]|uniref:OpgC domain-containing protein n=1 Tax=Aquabacterium sp. J223 TaxID=2898431 RepID=UPI0021ADAF27|nr:OpgC domain-containing protein [Aquabacterium sp. J223]UUX97207.1 OpgC domain-containing protein [Aquabacterium sp. J223]
MATERRWEIDALRGLMLVLMTVTHLPTAVSSPLGQPFGMVSAAEGFVLLSGYMAGLVYHRRQLQRGEEAMATALWRRAWKLYLCQVALLVFLFSVVAAVGVWLHEPAVTNLLNYYLDRPWHALAASLALLYNPPMLDILPLYVVFMIGSPLLLLHAGPRGWPVILALSLALWLAEQFGLGGWLYAGLPVTVPLTETGSFKPLAWQFVWVLGLWMGAQHAAGRPLAPRIPAWLLRAAVAWAAVGLAVRHGLGQVPADPTVALLFDKWQVAPLRLLNLLALLLIVLRWGPALVAWLPRGVPALELLGRASLPVFCAHLVAALLALALFGPPGEHGWAADAAILVLSFGLLYGVAFASAEVDRRAARAKARVSAWRAARPPLRSSAPR